MIECINHNIYYNHCKKSKYKKGKKIITFLIILAIIFGVFLYYKYVVTNLIVSIIKAENYAISTECVNKAVLASTMGEVKYEQLINVEKDSSGNITLISANSVNINNLSKNIAIKSRSLIENKIKEGIKIPLLAFTGISFLSGVGSKISIKTITVSSVESDFKTEFTSVGINQTLHSLFIVINVNVMVEMPLHSTEIKTSSKVMLSETVLVGKVPEIYFNNI